MRPTRQHDDLTCVVDLPEALACSYVPPDGFDADPVSQSARTLIYVQVLERVLSVVSHARACFAALLLLMFCVQEKSDTSEKSDFSESEDDEPEDVLKGESRKRKSSDNEGVHGEMSRPSSKC